MNTVQVLKEAILVIAFLSALFFGFTGTDYMFGSNAPWQLPFILRVAVNVSYISVVSLLFQAARAGIRK